MLISVLFPLAKNNQVKVKNVIKDLIRQDQIKDFEYDEVRTNFVSLPRTSVKIHSDSWTKITARETLKKYMKIFNLGRGMLIRYYAKVEPDTYFEQRKNMMMLYQVKIIDFVGYLNMLLVVNYSSNITNISYSIILILF